MIMTWVYQLDDDEELFMKESLEDTVWKLLLVIYSLNE